MQTLIFNPSLKHDNLSWHKETSTFVAEISCISLENPTFDPIKDVFIVNKATGKFIIFSFIKNDVQNGEVQGWRYKAIDGNIKPCSLLIIND